METLKDQTREDHLQDDGDFDFLNDGVSDSKTPNSQRDHAIDNYSRFDRNRRDMSFAEDMRKVHQVDPEPEDMPGLLRYGLLTLSILVLGGLGILAHIYLLPPTTQTVAEATGNNASEPQSPIASEVAGDTASVDSPTELLGDTIDTQEAGGTDLLADAAPASDLYDQFKSELSSLENMIANGEFDAVTDRVNSMDRTLYLSLIHI